MKSSIQWFSFSFPYPFSYTYQIVGNKYHLYLLPYLPIFISPFLSFLSPRFFGGVFGRGTRFPIFTFQRWEFSKEVRRRSRGTERNFNPHSPLVVLVTRGLYVRFMRVPLGCKAALGGGKGNGVDLVLGQRTKIIWVHNNGQGFITNDVHNETL